MTALGRAVKIPDIKPARGLKKVGDHFCFAVFKVLLKSLAANVVVHKGLSH